MKNNSDKFIENSLKTLNKISFPTDKQKEAILQNVLNMQEYEKVSKIYLFRNMVRSYPWRFAFGISTIQTVILTILFGSKYTNVIVRFLGR